MVKKRLVELIVKIIIYKYFECSRRLSVER
jgi:hypothetical protein